MNIKYIDFRHIYNNNVSVFSAECFYDKIFIINDSYTSKLRFRCKCLTDAYQQLA